MDTASNRPSPFITDDQVARSLGIPRNWLRSEAEAGRIPSIVAGRRRLFDVEQVRNALRQRAEQAGRNAEGATDVP